MTTSRVDSAQRALDLGVNLVELLALVNSQHASATAFARSIVPPTDFAANARQTFAIREELGELVGQVALAGPPGDETSEHLHAALKEHLDATTALASAAERKFDFVARRASASSDPDLTWGRFRALTENENKLVERFHATHDALELARAAAAEARTADSNAGRTVAEIAVQGLAAGRVLAELNAILGDDSRASGTNRIGWG